jgi:hypothetical protein
MGTDRWDEERGIHYYEYTPETIKRYPGRDAYTVAEAYLYAQGDPPVALGIIIIVSALELRSRGMSRAVAIEKGRELIRRHLSPDVAGGFAEHARTMRQSETYLFSSDDLPLGRVFPATDIRQAGAK